jgi:hypothetical protein
MQHPDIQKRTVDWPDRAQELQRERHKVVHSVVLHDGRSGWSGYHPHSRNLRRMETREIVRLAEQAREHEGNYRSIYEWRRALGVEPQVIEPDNSV